MLAAITTHRLCYTKQNPPLTHYRLAMTVSDRLLEIQNTRRQLKEEEALLAHLPLSLPLEQIFQARGMWHIMLVGSALTALAALPPSNADMRLEDGSWRASPKPEPLNWNQRILAVIQDGQGLTWYHQLPTQDFIRVRVLERLSDAPAGYEPALAVHNQVFVRKLVPRQQGMEESLEAKWNDRWAAFCDQEGYDAQQRQVLAAVRAQYQRGREAAFGLRAEIVRRVREFGAGFNQAQVERLVAFATDVRIDLKRDSDTLAPVGIAKATAAIDEFQALYLDKVANVPDVDVLTYWVREKTGYPVSVSIRTTPGSYQPPGEYQLWIHLWGWNDSAVIRVPEVYDPTGFDWQNPPFYRFVPNEGQF